MKKLAALIAVLVTAGCSTPSQLVYSSGFSFSPYDYVVVAKPDSRATSPSLYGMDVELANLLSRYNFKVVGDNEYSSFSPENKAKTLAARLAINASDKRINMSVSFDDLVSGRTGASVTTYTKGKIFKLADRTKAFDNAAKEIVAAFEHDKGLTITEKKR